MIEALQRSGGVVVVDQVEEVEVLIEFPVAEEWRERTGWARFVRLRKPVDGAFYALVRVHG